MKTPPPPVELVLDPAVIVKPEMVTVTLLASLLARLSDVYRSNCLSRGLDDPGHAVLEGVLVVSAGLTISAFVIWFFFVAGTSPVPIGIQV